MSVNPHCRPDGASRAWRTTMRRRLLITTAIFGVWSAAIAARLAHLQVIRHDDLVVRAERQQLRTVTAPAKRGEILDRNGRVLAYSVDADTIYAVPSEIAEADGVAAAICGALDECSGRERQAMADRMRRRGAFAYVRRRVAPDEARRVAALNLEGIGFHKENRRFYPRKELAAHLLGYVGIDNQGLSGIELVYDRQIRGRAGTILVQTDARSRPFSRVERPPTSGASIELTIDEYLQHIVERELRASVFEHRASGGSAVVMDPQTGEILAMANEPTFNPNAYAKTPASSHRNRAVQDIYEPGSTFKIVTASAAIEEGVLGVDDPIDVSAGMIRFGARRIDDVHRYGVLSFTDVIVKSSNVGAIKVGLKLGPDRLGRYVWRYGFGQVLSREFNGATSGIVWDPQRLDDSALASVSMGYQVGVTPLQMAIATSAVANGGAVLEPRVVRAVVADGKRVETSRRVVRTAVTPDTAATLTAIMEAVVDRGTATTARIDGFTIAGKTGTAAKLVNGRYSHSDYNASFVGFVPSRDPAFAIVVVIDSPHGGRGYYGGQVAAPVFKRIAEAALRHAGIGPNLNPPPPVVVASGIQNPDTPIPTAVGTPAVLLSANPAADPGLMPDLRGMSAREALRTLARVGLSASVSGSGFVAEQTPAAGEPLDRAASCALVLRRDLVAAAAGSLP